MENTGYVNKKWSKKLCSSKLMNFSLLQKRENFFLILLLVFQKFPFTLQSKGQGGAQQRP